ncbi:GAF domain-containing protein [Halovenus aranensis]|uniref:GAF domain-containing protein n=1 Tax=Halovenus aranensis TaxID=890420 RepID=UPI001FE232FF|nr:GAF domain-containing protein [Halovenus aranensis]
MSVQRQQAKSLAELHNASQDLVEAQEREEVFDRLLDAAITITGVDSATLFQFEETENTLLPTNSFGRETSPVAIEPGQGPRWKAFADQATRVLEPGPKTHVRDDVSTLLILSLGDRCVLQCVSEKPEALDEQQRELVETLVAMAEAVLNRTTREQQLRRREAQLQSQSAVADRLERVNGIIRRLSREFVNIRTREALDTTVCESLCDVDEFEFVWFGMVGNGVVKPVATSGGHSDYLEAQAPVETTRREKSLPAGRAAVTEDIVIIEKIADEIHDGEWQTKALAQSLLSVISIPVKHNGVRYGILTLYANQANTFGENMKTALQELADIVACACYRIEQERASRYDRERRVDFTVKAAQTPLLSVAEKIGSNISVLSVKRTHLTTTAYIESPDANPSDCVSAGKTTAGIDAVQSTGPDTYRYRVEADEVGLVEMITECGGIVESIATIEDRLQVQTRFPDTDATDSICTAISDKCDGVTIAHARPTADSTHYTEELFDELSDRQYEALQMAFQYGYFSWPKQSTGEDVAEEMGVAPSTFTEHVRRAESALLTKLLAYEARSR